MKDNRAEWIQRAAKGELSPNGLELLLYQRHLKYLSQFKEQKQDLNSNLVTEQT